METSGFFSDILLVGLILFAIIIVIFLVLREVNCWYWKINERVSLMKKQNLLLQKLIITIKNKGQINSLDSEQLSDSDNIEDSEFDKDLFDGNITIKNKNTGKVQTVSMEYWENLKNNYSESIFEIIEYHKKDQ